MKNKISWNRLYRKIYIASDEVKDKERYDAVANEIISQPVHSLTKKFGLNGIPEIQLDIYKKYYDIANKSISPTMQVLELGSGIGIHSGVLAKNILGGRLFINDISKVSLEINNKVHPAAVTLNSSMECISLPNNSLDFVFSCAALSYGDPDLVDKEILRLLKVNGNLVILDSLNHNIFYRLNRFIKFLSGKRTFSSISRIPNLNRLDNLSAHFKSTKLFFYGSYLWVIPVFTYLIGRQRSVTLHNILEKYFPSRKNSFKFIMHCEGLIKNSESV
jgi:ubiquinone/menaquinone biosynthesis C-methylase UbiE